MAVVRTSITGPQVILIGSGQPQEVDRTRCLAEHDTHLITIRLPPTLTLFAPESAARRAAPATSETLTDSALLECSVCCCRREGRRNCGSTGKRLYGRNVLRILGMQSMPEVPIPLSVQPKLRRRPEEL